jgi:outer membrane receptor protein involved in Fe transport
MTNGFRKTKLSSAISHVLAPAVILTVPVTAVGQSGLEEIVVTATRRSELVQDIPINITALAGQEIEQNRLVSIEEIARYVPGLQVVDRGPRDEITDIIVRGLNTDGLGPGFISDTVASYIGEIPLPVDVKTNDLERVEVLIGPQGTLYGSGTLGGAIRYIPNKPDPDGFSLDVHTSLYTMSESSGLSHDTGFVANLPLVDSKLALRVSLDYLDDEGFIDYTRVVQEAGVSDPEPDFSDPTEYAANLQAFEDVNGEQTTSGRVALRWTPNNSFDGTLTYFFQNVEAEGRQLVHVESIGTGSYESGLRYLEPSAYDNQLLSLEIIADLGFAELTSATAYSEYDELGQRDQTDLLLDFEYGYEFFPTFSSFTREIDDQWTITQELRLVSTSNSAFSWIIGAYFNKFDQYATSEEFTPHFDQFAIDNFGGVQLRPDSLEYYSITDDAVEESAIFGELSLDFADDWSATLGFRVYEFDEELTSGFALPLFETVFLGEPQDSINIDPGVNNAEDDGTLFKFNLSYEIDEARMTYLTVSEGYRIGGVNAVPACTPEQISSGTQQLCALPNEVLIKPDTTTNYELGLRSYWLDNRLLLNAAVYFIEWEDIQVSDVTEFGSLPITGNGSGAESKGIELASRFAINDNWELSGTYSYTNAELTDDAPGLVSNLTATAGTRLPGSPENQGSLTLEYDTTVWDGKELDIRYSWVHQGNIFNIPGGGIQLPLDPDNMNMPTNERMGEKLPTYNLHSISATVTAEQWYAQMFVDNLYDEYAIVGTRTTQRLLAENRGTIGGFSLRSYGRYIARPRTIGLSFGYNF